jgi:selenophosphate synthase
MNVNLTEYSHGAGCGCKIAPAVLEQILASEVPLFHHPQLLVGNETSDDIGQDLTLDPTSSITSKAPTIQVGRQSILHRHH